MVVTGSYKARWISRGETTHIHGMGLFTGLFYVGRTFDDGGGHDKYIVNPSLPIGKSARDYIPGHDPFGTSYEALPPSGRRAYLDWIAGSCRDTAIPVQFVRLYASGLYRRVFIEKGSDSDIVLSEARRLMSLHAENRVFRDLMANLIVFATALGYKKGQRPDYKSDWRQSIHTAAEVTLRIASLIGGCEPVGVDDAFVFALERSKVRLKSVVDIEGVRLLWKRVYLGRFPDGIVVDQPSQKIKFAIAMPDGVSTVKIPVPDWCKRLPDPSEATSFCQQIDSMFEDCVSELASYSKLVRKTPSAAGSLEAINVLPKQLVATSLAGRFASVKATLDNALAKQGVVASKVLKLFEFMELPFRDDAEMSAGVRKLIAGAMDKMDIAFEPDGRFGAVGLTTKGSVVFFRGENGLPVDWEGAYALHRACADFVIGHLCVKGAQAVAAERALFEVRQSDQELDDRERTRLAAHARSLVVDFGVRKGAPFRQGKLSEQLLLRLADAVVGVVASLPDLDVGTIATAEKFIEKLGADRRELHAAIHRRFPADQDGLVSVVKAEPTRGVTIPSRPYIAEKSEPSPPAIDLDRLKMIEAETVMVSGLLSDIFAGEDVTQETLRENVALGGFSGFDVAHSEILEAVMAKGEMGRIDFDALVRSKRLLPDGAIETINDIAIDAFGEPVLFDNGSIVFEEHLRVELEKTRVK
jgi:hypothetical protein